VETVKAAASAQLYRPRHPECTVLYRALAHHFERFVLVYEERFQAAHGYLRRCVEPARRSARVAARRASLSSPRWPAASGSSAKLSRR
jgi:hypothetical protein